MHSALLSNIDKNMRIICADWSEKDFLLRIFVSKQLYVEKAKENADIILTEFETLQLFESYKFEVIVSDAPYYKLDLLKLTLFILDET